MRVESPRTDEKAKAAGLSKPLPWFAWFLIGKLALIALIVGGVLIGLG